MNEEGYPTEDELLLIEQWPHDDFMALADYVRERWCWKDCVKSEWVSTQHYGYEYHFTLITGGWSGNESLVNAMLQNQFIQMFYYAEWKRGGYHKFIYRPSGYMLVADYCKQTGISRQAVYQSKDKYHWLTVSDNKRLIKPMS